MNLDLSILRLLKTRKNFERYRANFPDTVLAGETVRILQQFGNYFKATEADTIHVEEFFPFVVSRFPNLSEAKKADMLALIRPVEKDNPVGLDQQIISNALSTQLGRDAIAAIESWNEGGELDLGETLRSLAEEHDKALNRKVKQPRVQVDFAAMLEAEKNEEGLHWRTALIDNYFKPLRGGDFGIIAGRPDRGKTTTVAGEITFMAPQLLKLHKDEFRPLIWLNNEGPGSRIQQRIIQSALDLTISDMVGLGPAELQRRYIEAVGHPDIIQVYDIHGFQSYEVEELFRKLNPGLVVFDMIDNIKFTGQGINGGERTDQVLEAMYQAAREWCVKYDFPGLATSQISDIGEGQRYPPQNALKDSRTGKQGACDFIITVGFDPNMPSTRFIGSTKQKTKRQGVAPMLSGEVFFDGDRGRLRAPRAVTEVDE